MARVEEASFEYLQWSELYEEEKPYEIFLDDTSLLNGVKRTNLEFKRSPVQQIQDIRGNESSYSLDTHGFQWVTSSVNVQDLRNEKGILGAYIPAMECLLLDRVEGADRVIIFDWRTRLSTSQEEFQQKTIDLNNGLDPLQPVVHPHIDQTSEGAIARAFHHLGPEAENLLKGRFRIMNVWRPLTVVEDWPLAVCDGRSVDSDDLVASDFVRRNYQGESLFALYNESHRWHFMSQQRPDEALLFKVYDSSDDVESKYCLHASFPMMDDAGPKRPRESIECRALVFTNPTEDLGATAQLKSQGHIPLLPHMPLIYGTAAKRSETANYVLSAVKAGFRAFDTAAQPKWYDEALVGKALRQVLSEGIVTRSQLWIQTKFSNLESRDTTSMPYDSKSTIADQVRSSVESSLANLQTSATDHIDCLILHAPLATMEETFEAWRALSTFVPEKVHTLGISNTAVTTLSILYEKSTIKPAVVQNRFCKRTNYDAQVRQFCRNRAIIYQGFGLLKDSSPLLQSDVVGQAAEVVDISREEALFVLARAIGVMPLNGTTRAAHMIGDMRALERFDSWRKDRENDVVWDEILRDFERALEGPHN